MDAAAARRWRAHDVVRAPAKLVPALARGLAAARAARTAARRRRRRRPARRPKPTSCSRSRRPSSRTRSCGRPAIVVDRARRSRGRVCRRHAEGDVNVFQADGRRSPPAPARSWCRPGWTAAPAPPAEPATGGNPFARFFREEPTRSELVPGDGRRRRAGHAAVLAAHAPHRPRVHLDRRPAGGADARPSSRPPSSRASPLTIGGASVDRRAAGRVPLRRSRSAARSAATSRRAGGDRRLRRDAGDRADRRERGAAARGPCPRAQRDAAVRCPACVRVRAAARAGRWTPAGAPVTLHVARRRRLGAVHRARRRPPSRRAPTRSPRRSRSAAAPSTRRCRRSTIRTSRSTGSTRRRGDGARARSDGGAGEGRLRHGRRRSRARGDPPARARRHAAHRRRPRRRATSRASTRSSSASAPRRAGRRSSPPTPGCCSTCATAAR